MLISKMCLKKGFNMNYCLKKAISILLAFTFLLPTLCEVYGNTSFIAYASDQQFSDECEADAFYEENYVTLFEGTSKNPF